MRIGLLNRSDIDGGAGIVALRLYSSLRKRIDVKYLVGIKHRNNDSILIHYKSDLFAKFRNLIERKIQKERSGKFPFSLCISPFPLNRLLKHHKVDVAHLHWIGAGFVSINSLSKLDIPIVWTMHDAWSFTGGCHITYDCKYFIDVCRKCPQLNSSKESDLSTQLYFNKLRSYNNIKNITFVSPSKWLANKAKESSLLQNKNIAVIPNGIDTIKFCPNDGNGFRANLGIKPDIKIILFGAVYATSDKNKGYEQLIAAIDLLKDSKFEIMVFGSQNIETKEISGKTTYFLGRIWEEEIMAKIYSAADLTVVPSLSENLSTVIMESMSCGTPVVAFDIGGNPELIDHKQNGYLAKPYEINDLADGIEWTLFNQEIQNLNENARKKIVQSFDIEDVADKYIELYKSVHND